MAKVYVYTFDIQLPKPDYRNYDRKKEAAKEQDFLEKIKAWAKNRNPDDELAGEEYTIPHADGYARYVVLSSKPVKLMHLPIGDAWDSPWADRVTKADIVKGKKLNETVNSMFLKL